jgi:SET domain-containing protein
MLVIKKSSIQGKGLFTDSTIRARSKLGEFTGERISIREARRRAKQRKRIAIVEVSDRQAIDGNIGGGPFRFINHSCDANVFIRIAYGRAEFYARADIAAGEELTTDYGSSHHDGKLRCVCSSLNCRGFI